MRRIGVDTGGTFTDFIFVSDGAIEVLKLPSTPRRPEAAFLTGVKKLLRSTDTDVEIVHGTTVGTNAVLERKGARTALLTTAGFEDVIEIGRQNRPGLYWLKASKPRPLVPRELRFGIRERVTSSGDVLVPVDESQLEMVADRLVALGVESIAVCYLFSFLRPEHEAQTAVRLQRLGLPISVSHRILPEYREYERTSTTVINAYLAPLMATYLRRMAEGLERLDEQGAEKRWCRLRLMQSNGGAISAEVAAEQPVRTVLSGPAGGVVGAYEVARRAGFARIITFDMGGTSTDVSLVDGAIRTTTEARVAELPIGIPVIDIHTVGAGGGSIARLDEGGALRVGPESAGADPGPVCYGIGRDLTVTDAHLILGRLDPHYFLGGQMTLDLARTEEHFAAFCRNFPSLGRTTAEAVAVAQGILDVANANMARAIKVISVERGYDPREFTLVAFGGAGGLHACDLAEMLSIPRVLIPENPGLLSALGVLLSDVVKDYSQTVMLPQAEIVPEKVDRWFIPLEERARQDLQAEGFSPSAIRFARYLDLRYVGQSFELSVPWSANAVEEFHRAHEQRYGYADRTRAVELVTVRVRAWGETEKPSFRARESAGPKPSPSAMWARRRVYFSTRPEETTFYRREELAPGNVLDGPAIVLEYSATTVIPPAWQGLVDAWGNLILQRKK
ncbi:MAG TPA: hydantoinase/oxoprolinase family protein [Blastocatellia bacterium]|nr:hydantoinase/oxoprolinase family protein [Blastocatellia bacterium]